MALISVFFLMVMTRWLLGCLDIALVYLLFCSVPDTIAFYSVGRHHWASYVASYAHSLIPVLWNFKKIAPILEFYWRSCLSPQCLWSVIVMRRAFSLCLAVCTGVSVLICTGSMSTLLIIANRGTCRPISISKS